MKIQKQAIPQIFDEAPSRTRHYSLPGKRIFLQLTAPGSREIGDVVSFALANRRRIHPSNLIVWQMRPLLATAAHPRQISQATGSCCPSARPEPMEEAISDPLRATQLLLRGFASAHFR